MTVNTVYYLSHIQPRIIDRAFLQDMSKHVHVERINSEVIRRTLPQERHPTLFGDRSHCTASMACSMVALTYRFGAIVLPFYLLLLLVGEARIALKRHTIAQTIADALLGIVLSAIQLLSFFPRLSYILTG